jgi:hypothetical protein
MGCILQDGWHTLSRWLWGRQDRTALVFVPSMGSSSSRGIICGNKTCPRLCLYSRLTIVGPSHSGGLKLCSCSHPLAIAFVVVRLAGACARLCHSGAISRRPFMAAPILYIPQGLQRLGPCSGGYFSHACGFDAGSVCGRPRSSLVCPNGCALYCLCWYRSYGGKSGVCSTLACEAQWPHI